jgi:uncharacterized protein (TIGR02145 family)
MAENLKVTRDPRGNAIASYVYNDDDSMAPVYGRLYTWEAMINGSTSPGAQRIAPDGWHMPFLDEWQTLIDYLGGEEVAGHSTDIGSAPIAKNEVAFSVRCVKN